MRNRSWSTKLRALLGQHFFMSLTNSLMLLWNLVELEINGNYFSIILNLDWTAALAYLEVCDRLQ
jgi:hypothetical protein